MTHPPQKVGLLQAAGLVSYVSFFAFAVSTSANWFQARGIEEPGPMLGMSIFLLAFVLSAAVCGSLFLGYPLVLFSRNQRAEAVWTVLWTLCWLALFLGAFFFLILLLA